MTRTAEQAARSLIQQNHEAVLSTLSDQEGQLFPFGSVVPYVCDRQCFPVLLISRLAEHSRNIGLRPQVSLLVQAKAQGDEDIQTLARATLLAQAVPVDDRDCRKRYFAVFPQSRDYFEQLDFEFFRLHPIKLRYIAGFGQAHWLDVTRVFAATMSD